MLDVQRAVRNGTKALHKFIEGAPDKKPRPRDKQDALQLSDQQKAILAEVTKTIHFLKAAGTADAFTEVFQGLQEDIKLVLRRLASGEIGPATQALQEDIIDTLQELIRSSMKR
jgi:hypothetical protein